MAVDKVGKSTLEIAAGQKSKAAKVKPHIMDATAQDEMLLHRETSYQWLNRKLKSHKILMFVAKKATHQCDTTKRYDVTSYECADCSGRLP